MKKIKFARFGGLSSVNQKGYDANDDGFHSPPSNRGFYAFVWPYYEFFLLSSGLDTSYPWAIGTKFSYVKDSKGNVIDDKHAEYEHFSNSGKYWTVPTKLWYNFEKRNQPKEDLDYNDFKKEWDVVTNKWDTEHAADAKFVLAEKPSPKIFEYKGDIWHHLENTISPHGVLKKKGGWIKSTFEEYSKALEKDMHISRRLQASYSSNKGLPMSTKNPYRGVCKDQLEVFIEKL
jgi:hypothetical protein